MASGLSQAPAGWCSPRVSIRGPQSCPIPRLILYWLLAAALCLHPVELGRRLPVPTAVTISQLLVGALHVCPSADVFCALIFLRSLPAFCFFTIRDPISAARSHSCATRLTAGGCSPSSSRGVVRSASGFTLLNLGLLRAFAFRQSRTFRSCPVPRLG